MIAALRLAGAATLAALLFTPGARAAESPEPGTAAPEFRLQDQNGKWHSLSEYRGKWVVLYFYPKDNTPGCTTQACELRDDIFKFRQLGAVILGVSVDDVASKKAFADEYGLPFPVLADPDKKVAATYGVLTKFMGLMALARRDTFIIDPQGKVAKHYVKVDPKGHSQLVLAELERLGARPAAAGKT
jgi:peroxiredoxin Q/BCP